MATLAQTLAPLAHDPMSRYLALDAGATTIDSAEEVAVTLTFPIAFKTAHLISIVCYASGIATVPAFDEFDRGSGLLLRTGAQDRAQGLVFAKAFRQYGGTATPTAISYAFLPHPFYGRLFRVSLKGGDQVTFSLPPLDDGGAPTVNLYTRAELVVLEYA